MTREILMTVPTHVKVSGQGRASVYKLPFLCQDSLIHNIGLSEL